MMKISAIAVPVCLASALMLSAAQCRAAETAKPPKAAKVAKGAKAPDALAISKCIDNEIAKEKESAPADVAADEAYLRYVTEGRCVYEVAVKNNDVSLCDKHKSLECYEYFAVKQNGLRPWAGQFDVAVV